MAPTWGKFFSISFCRALACLSASVRSDTFLGMVYFLWKVRKLTPDTHTARDRCREALSTPLCWMFCHSADGSSSGCGSGSVGSGWPSAMRRGSTGLEGCCDASATGVPGAESLTATLGRLRFNVDLGPFAGFSLGVSGVGGAASSRARALVERLGSVMMGGLLMDVHMRKPLFGYCNWSLEKDIPMTRSPAGRRAALASQHRPFLRNPPK